MLLYELWQSTMVRFYYYHNVAHANRQDTRHIRQACHEHFKDQRRDACHFGQARNGSHANVSA